MNEFLLESQDLNGDGIIEFSTSVRPKGQEEYPNAEFRPSEERYVNIEQGYFITIPKELVGEITIQEGSKSTQYLLYTDTDEKWLEVHTFDGKVKNYEAQSK